jgi:hypothetical protein
MKGEKKNPKTTYWLNPNKIKIIRFETKQT